MVDLMYTKRNIYEKKHNNEISKNNESINLLFLDIPLLY